MASVSAGGISIQIDQGFLEKWNTLTKREKLAVATDYNFQARNKYRINLNPSELCPTLFDLKNNIISLKNVTVSSIFIKLEAEVGQQFRLIVWIFNRESDEFLSCFIKSRSAKSEQFSFNIYSRNYGRLDQLKSIQKGEASKGWNKSRILRAISDLAAGRGLFVANVGEVKGGRGAGQGIVAASVGGGTGGRGAGQGMFAANVGGGTGGRRGRSRRRNGGGQGSSSSESRSSSRGRGNLTKEEIQKQRESRKNARANLVQAGVAKRSASGSPPPKPKAPGSPNPS